MHRKHMGGCQGLGWGRKGKGGWWLQGLFRVMEMLQNQTLMVLAQYIPKPTELDA